MGQLDSQDEIINNYYNNQDFHITNAPFEPKLPVLSNQVAWQLEKDQRPVNKNFHPDKGYKFDVLLSKEERYPIENERIGNMRTFPEPIATVLR